MTATITEIEAVDLTDFAFTRPCTPFSHDCPNEAKWELITTCSCGGHIPCCDEHQRRADVYLKTNADKGLKAWCNICFGSMTPFTSQDWWFEKL